MVHQYGSFMDRLSGTIEGKPSSTELQMFDQAEGLSVLPVKFEVRLHGLLCVVEIEYGEIVLGAELHIRHIKSVREKTEQTRFLTPHYDSREVRRLVFDILYRQNLLDQKGRVCLPDPPDA